MITDTPPTLSDNTLTIEQEIRVKASLETTFAALLEQLGPGFATPAGESLRMKIEPWPGGRWFRDFGDNNGHYWGTVQAIKRPTLLEFTGPMMMSAAVTHNVQYRLSEENGVTLIKFHHYGFGIIPAESRTSMPQGWSFLHDGIRRRAEAGIQ